MDFNIGKVLQCHREFQHLIYKPWSRLLSLMLAAQRGTDGASLLAIVRHLHAVALSMVRSASAQPSIPDNSKPSRDVLSAYRALLYLLQVADPTPKQASAFEAELLAFTHRSSNLPALDASTTETCSVSSPDTTHAATTSTQRHASLDVTSPQGSALESPSVGFSRELDQHATEDVLSEQVGDNIFKPDEDTSSLSPCSMEKNKDALGERGDVYPAAQVTGYIDIDSAESASFAPGANVAASSEDDERAGTTECLPKSMQVSADVTVSASSPTGDSLFASDRRVTSPVVADNASALALCEYENHRSLGEQQLVDDLDIARCAAQNSRHRTAVAEAERAELLVQRRALLSELADLARSVHASFIVGNDSDLARRKQERLQIIHTAVSEDYSSMLVDHRRAVEDCQVAWELVGNLEAALLDARSERSAAQSRLELLQTDHESAMNEMKSAARKTEEQLAATTAQLSALSLALASAQDEKKAAVQMQESCADRLCQVERENITVKAKVDELEAATSGLVNMRDEAELRVRQLQDRLRVKEDSHALLQEHLRAVTVDRDELSLELTDLKAENGRLCVICEDAVVREAALLADLGAARADLQRQLSSNVVLQNDLHASQSRVDFLHDELKSLKSQCDKQADDLSESRSAFASSQVMNQVLMADVAQLRDVNVELAADVASARSDAEGSQAELRSQQAAVNVLSSELDAARARIASLQTDLEVSTSAYAALRASEAASRVEMEKRLGDLSFERDTVLATAEHAAAQHASTRDELEVLQVRLSALQKEYQLATTETQRHFSVELGAMRTLLSAAEASATTMRDDLTALQTLNVSLLDKVRSVEQAYGLLEVDAASVRSLSDARALRITSLLADIDGAAHSIAALQSELHSERVDASALRTMKDSLSSELASTKETLDAIQARNATLEEEAKSNRLSLVSLQNEVSTVQSSSVSLHAEFSLLRMQYDERCADNISLQAQVSDLSAANDARVSANAERATKLAAFKARLCELEAERAELSAQLVTAASQRDTLETSVASLSAERDIAANQKLVMHDQIAGLLAAQSELQLQDHELRSTLSKALQDIENARADERTSQEQLQLLRRKLDDSEATRLASELALEDLQTRFEHQSADLKAAQTEQNALQVQVDEFRAKLSEALHVVEHVQDRERALQLQVQRLQDSSDAAATASLAEIDMLRSEKTALLLDVSLLRSEGDMRASETNALRTMCASLEREVIEAQHESRSLQADLATLRCDISTLQSTNAALHSQLRVAADDASSALIAERSKVSVIVARSVHLEQERDATASACMELRGCLSESQRDVETLRESIAALETEHSSSITALQVVTTERDELRTRLEALSASLAVLQRAVDTADAERITWEAERAKQLSIADALRSSNCVLQAEADALHASSAKLRSDVAEMQASINEFRLSNAQLQGDLANAWQEVDSLRADIASAHGDRERLVDRDSSGLATMRPPDSTDAQFEAVKELVTSFISQQRLSGRWSGHANQKSLDTLSTLGRMLGLSEIEMDAVGCHDEVASNLGEATVRLLSSGRAASGLGEATVRLGAATARLGQTVAGLLVSSPSPSSRVLPDMLGQMRVSESAVLADDSDTVAGATSHQTPTFLSLLGSSPIAAATLPLRDCSPHLADASLAQENQLTTPDADATSPAECATIDPQKVLHEVDTVTHDTRGCPPSAPKESDVKTAQISPLLSSEQQLSFALSPGSLQAPRDSGVLMADAIDVTFDDSSGPELLVQESKSLAVVSAPATRISRGLPAASLELSPVDVTAVFEKAELPASSAPPGDGSARMKVVGHPSDTRISHAGWWPILNW